MSLELPGRPNIPVQLTRWARHYVRGLVRLTNDQCFKRTLAVVEMCGRAGKPTPTQLAERELLVEELYRRLIANRFIPGESPHKRKADRDESSNQSGRVSHQLDGEDA